MSKRLFIGIYLLLLAIAGLLSLIAYNQYTDRDREEWPHKYINSFHMRDTHAFEEAMYDRDLPLDKPHMTEPYVAAWAARAVSDTMTFGYDNYEQRIDEVSKYYTDEGQKSLLSTFERTKLVEMAKKNQQILFSQPETSYVVQSEGVVDGVYQWVLEIPILMAFRYSTSISNTSWRMKVRVIRTRDKRHRYGMAIDEYVR